MRGGDELMNNHLEIFSTSLFTISERWSIMDFSLYAKNSDLFVKGNKDKVVKVRNSELLVKTLQLGYYEYLNNVSNDFKEFIDFDSKLFYAYARDDFSNDLILDTHKLKHFNDKKFHKLLNDWINVCGLPKENFDENNKIRISAEDIISILLYCKMFYEYKKSFDNSSLNKINFNINYEYNFKTNKVTRVVNNLTDILFYELLVVPRLKDSQSINQCEYCLQFFYGGKRQLCCSSRCKDLKNRKYEKRKEKKQKEEE